MTREEAVSDSLHLCVTCNMLYCTQTTLQTHMRNHHNPLYSEHRPGTVVELPLADVIAKMWNESAESRKSAGFRCLKCNTHFSQRGIASHICVSVDQQVSCVTLDPGGLLLSESQQKLLFKRPNKSIMCHKCGDTFGNLEKLRAHLELGHGGGGPAGARLFQCQMCPYSTNIQRSFKLHLCNHHGTDVGPKTYVCEVCGKGYSTRGGLNVHRQSRHIRSRTFPCQHCPKTFYLRRYLDKHLKMHSGVRDYRCDACGHAFKSQSNLEFHRRIHTGYKPYRCELCDVAFAQKNSLNVHMKKHLK